MSQDFGKKLRWSLLALAGAAAISSAVLLNQTPHQRQGAFLGAKHQNAEAAIVAGADGKLLKWAVLDGSEVHKGDLIAQLDTSNLEGKLSELEMQLHVLEADGASTILPMPSSTISGSLPKMAPSPQFVKVPALMKGELNSIPIPNQPAAETNPNLPLLKDAEAKLAKIKNSAKAQEGAVIEAQAIIDSLDKKIEEAQSAAKTASDKASNAKALLEQGVISASRAAELEADEENSSRALAALLMESEGAKRALKEASTARDKAKDQLPAAEKEVARIKELVTTWKPAPGAVPVASAPAPKQKFVYRAVPTAQLEAPTAEPVQLVVDEKKLDNIEEKRKSLTTQIEDLKAQIAAAKIFATEDGIVHLHKALNDVIVRGSVVATISK